MGSAAFGELGSTGYTEAGVVYKNVYPTFLRRHGIDCSFDLLFVCNIGGDVLNAVGLDLAA